MYLCTLHLTTKRSQTFQPIPAQFTTMATPQGRNNHGPLTTPTKVSPPRGSYLRSHEDAPPVAVPSCTLASHAAALLVSEKDFEHGMSKIISNSSVLTAWFTFQAFCGHVDCSRTICQWKSIKRIIVEHSHAWVARRLVSAGRSASVEYLKDMVLPELHALAVFVLSHKITRKPRHVTSRKSELTYHSYYQTDTAVLYLSSQTLMFLYFHVKPSSPFSISRPKERGLIQPWLLGQGAHIGLACEEFAKSKSQYAAADLRMLLTYSSAWSPYSLLRFPIKKTNGRENASELLQNSSTGMKQQVAHISDATVNVNGNKITIFRLSGEDMFELETEKIPKALSEHAIAQKVTLCDTLRRLLGWPKSSNLIGVSLHKNDERKPQVCIETLHELWHVIDSHEAPVFSLHTSVATPRPASTAPAIRPRPQSNYTNNAVLQLEPLIDELATRDAQLARPLLELIRQNHHRSPDHIQDVLGLFAPLKQRIAEEWKQADEMKSILEGVLGDKSQILKLEDLIGHLDKAHAEDAHAIFHIIRRNLTGGAAFAEELSRLFQPVKERNAETWKRASRLKKAFDEFDQASQAPGGSLAHASQSKSCGSTMELGKRKRDG